METDRGLSGLIRRTKERITAASESAKASREEVFRGIGIFEDATTRILFARVHRELAISEWGLYCKAMLSNSLPEKVTYEEVGDKLSQLVEHGFLQSRPNKEYPRFTIFYPTPKGVRVYQALRKV